MTTQPATKCDPKILKKGEMVIVLSGPSTVIEAMVVRARELTGAKTDWHYVGGRAFVKVLGDAADCTAVRDAVKDLIPTVLQ